MARGNAKAPIFLDATDCGRFLEILREVALRFSVVIYAYCLMPNHYHLVIQTRDGNLSVAIQYLNSVYSQWWNRRHGRCGHVLQGRFKAQLIQNERYLVAACRYVLKNPVRAGLADDPGAWQWSSYSASLHPDRAPDFLDTTLVHQFLSDQREAPCGTARTDGAGAGQVEPAVGPAVRGNAMFIGSMDFIEEKRTALRMAGSAGVRGREWRSIRPMIDTLLRTDGRHDDRGLLEAHDGWGFTQSEIAAHLGLSVDAVGRIFRNLRRRGVRSADLRIRPADLRI
jgi:REP element-mobilizing transposase RayT